MPHNALEHAKQLLEPPVVSREHRLRAQLEIARKRYHVYSLGAKVVPLLAVVIASVFLFAYYRSDDGSILLISIAIVYVAIAVFFGVFPIDAASKNEVDTIEAELALQETGVSALERRAERLLRAHEIQIRRYYDLAHSQGRAIFVIATICLATGTGIVVMTMYMIAADLFGTTSEPSSNIIIAALGAVGGILTNFLGFVVVRMYAHTSRTFSAFHDSLVGTYRVHMANYVIAKIQDPVKLDDTLREVAKLISAKAYSDE